MRLIRSKHQKLILQCYPPGKSVEKKPNLLELSYLLYYALTRRIKLEKVIEFVKQKTNKDVRSRKSGNLQVTLVLMSALIEKCADNLNVFAMQVCEILLQILTLRELPLCKSLVSTYGIFCRKLDNGLFSGDKLFVSLFSKLTLEMISVGQAQLDVDRTNAREWRLFSLLSSRHVFNCLVFNSSLSNNFVALCVPLLARTVCNTVSKEKMRSRLQVNLNVEQDKVRTLSRTITSKSAATHRMSMADTEEDSLNDDDLGDEAFCGLKTLFNTLSASQISEGVRAVEAFCYTEPTIDTEWGTTFFQTCASFIPVQLRFVALNTLLNKLTHLSDNTTAESHLFNEMQHVARYVLALVSSDFNMIGLSTSDVISQLLSLQKRLYLSLSDIGDRKEVACLSAIYSKCICNLSSHIYYFNQVRDSVEEIIAHVDGNLVQSLAENAKKALLFVMTLLDTIHVILERLSERSNAIARHRGTLENLDLSLNLLTISHAYPRFAQGISAADVSQLQAKYLKVVLFYLQNEMVLSNEQSADLQDESEARENMLHTPNYNNYIDNHDNIVRRIIHHSKGYFDEPSFTLENAREITVVLRTILDLTGINFVCNFVLSFDQWQITEASATLSARARDTTAYSLLISSLSALDRLYGDLLQSQLQGSTLARLIDSDVTARKSAGVWVSGARERDRPISGQDFRNEVTPSIIFDFFASTPLAQWLHHFNTTHNLTSAGSNVHSNEQMYGRESFKISNIDVPGLFRIVSPQSAESGLGLGSANDITSIYSGLLNGQGRANGNVTPETSQLTEASIHTRDALQSGTTVRSMAPRVQDLRHTVNGHGVDVHSTLHGQEPVSFSRSVLHRQVLTADLSTLLHRLDSEDDSKLVV